MKITAYIFSFVLILLSTANAAGFADAQFEGKYQVGKVFCNVKPVRMAYEIKWAKGSGVEYFFAADGTTFKSNPNKGKPNVFVFSDEEYKAGMFYRSDGKTFSVKRMKRN